MAIYKACARSTYLPILHGGSHRWKATNRFIPSLWRTSATVAVTPRGDFEGFRRQIGDGATPFRELGDSAPLERVVQKQLQYLSKDPFKIAQHVRSTITRGRFDEALLLTRKASRNGNITVSWNHLIEHLMGAQRLHAALKLYNEMKKRAQIPNAQTYTIIFNGCAQSDYPKLAVTESLRLYHTMLGSDMLKPNVAHLNAVLKVCSRADDLESMFGLLQTVDGARSPNNLTYTTILNALRVKEPPPQRSVETVDLTPEARLKAYRNKVDASIRRGKCVWDEVISRWRHGKVTIDEQLVCAMGRLLLSGGDSDREGVIPLVEQTMGIPKLYAGPARSQGPSLAGAQQAEPQTAEARAKAQDYARPGSNTLSMVMHTLGATRKTTLAPRYWDIFVGQLGVKPDSDNWFRFLLTLHAGKASTKASKYLQGMPHQMVRPETVRLVMRTCVADNLNNHAFENAERVLDVAFRTWQGKPDPETMRAYLRAAAANHHRFRRTAGARDARAATLALGKQLTQALDRLWEPMKLATDNFAASDVRNSMVKGAPKGMRRNELNELAAVARRMTAIAAKVMRDEMAGSETLEKLKERNTSLNRFITSFYNRGDVA